MTLSLVPVNAAPMSFGEVERLAQSIASSRLFGIQTPSQAIALMMIAQAEGLHPALAARDYDIIQGRPSKKAEAMLRDFLSQGGKVQWHTLSDTVADATFSHPQGGSVRISWDIDRANRAGLSTPMYKKFPRQMLRSRCVSEGVRTVWPLATSGMYVPEETAELPPHTGPTLEAEAEQPQSRRDQINAEVPLKEQPRERTPGELLDSFELAMRDSPDLEAVEKLIANKHVQRMLQTYQGEDHARLQGIIEAGKAAHAPVEHQQEDEDDGWPGPKPGQMAGAA